MQKRKEAVVKIVQAPGWVEFDCPHCGAENNIRYRDFSEEQGHAYWCDWSYTYCRECGEDIDIEELQEE